MVNRWVRFRANVSKVIYDVWMEKGQPDLVSAQDVLARYRQEIGEVTADLLAGELYMMEDDSSIQVPFIRTTVPNAGGELGYLRLRDINPTVLRALAEVEDIA